MNKNVSVHESARRQMLFSRYVEEEVVPYIRRAVRNEDARIAVAGASFGAFHAANQFFRRPELFDTLIAMSGFFDLEPDYLGGWMNDDIYFNNPMSFVPNIHDSHQRHMIEHAQVHIITGQGAYEAPHASRRFSNMLWDAGIWNNLDVWGHDMKHDWPTWRAMLPHYLGERVGF